MEGEDGDGLGHCELCFVGAGQEVVEACEMAVPHQQEAVVLSEVRDAGETVVAFAVLEAVKQ
jgi:hypothetical protein